MRRLFAVALLLSLLAGCGLVHEAQQALPTGPQGPYHDTYERWTRCATVYHDLSLVIEARATLRTPQFQQAYLRRYAEDYKLPAADLNRLLADEAAQQGRGVRVLLVARTGKREWNDLAKTDSVWKIYLQNESGERLPLTDKRHLENRTETAGFFYLEPWDEAYALTFGGENDAARFATGRLTLVVASVLGQAEFCWDVAAAGR